MGARPAARRVLLRPDSETSLTQTRDAPHRLPDEPRPAGRLAGRPRRARRRDRGARRKAAGDRGGPRAGRRFLLRAHAASGRSGGERGAALFPRRLRACPPPLVLVRRDHRGPAAAAATVLSCAVAAIPVVDRPAAAEL